MPSNIFGWKNYMYFFGGSQPAFHFLNRCSSRKCGESTLITRHPNRCPPGAAARTAETLRVVTVKLCNKTETFPDSIPIKSWVFMEIPGMEKKNKANFKKSTGHSGHSGRSQYSFHPTWATDRTAWRSKAMGPAKVPHRESPEARTKENGVPPCVPQPLPILFPYRFQEFEALGLYESGMAGRPVWVPLMGVCGEISQRMKSWFHLPEDRLSEGLSLGAVLLVQLLWEEKVGHDPIIATCQTHSSRLLIETFLRQHVYNSNWHAILVVACMNMSGSTKHCFWPASCRWSSSLQKWYLSPPARNQKSNQGNIILLYKLYTFKKRATYTIPLYLVQFLKPGWMADSTRTALPGSDFISMVYQIDSRLICNDFLQMAGGFQWITPWQKFHQKLIDRLFWNFKIGNRIQES